MVAALCYRPSLLKTWELMYLCASAMPPGKEFGAYLSEYVHDISNAPNGDPEIQALALNTWHSLKRSVKAGPRRSIPAQEEIEALSSGRKLTTIAFFLDETFEEITYDITTTVADAVEVYLKNWKFICPNAGFFVLHETSTLLSEGSQVVHLFGLQELAGIIKLSSYNTFSLFECRKVLTGSKAVEAGNGRFFTKTQVFHIVLTCTHLRSNGSDHSDRGTLGSG